MSQGDSKNSRRSLFQIAADAFHRCRSCLVVAIAYCSLRIYGFEGVTLAEVASGRYRRDPLKPASTSNPENLEGIVSVARECFENARKRRSVIFDKCKTLLTVSSLFLGLFGFLLPREFAFDATWMRVVAFVAVLSLMNTVMLLLVFFGVERETEVAIGNEDFSQTPEKFKVSLANSYLQSQAAVDCRTDYLADLYKCARFFALLAFAAFVMLFSVDSLAASPKNETDRIVRELRANPELVELLRGPQGEQGVPGKDAVIDKAKLMDDILGDPRLLQDGTPQEDEGG